MFQKKKIWMYEKQLKHRIKSHQFLLWLTSMFMFICLRYFTSEFVDTGSVWSVTLEAGQVRGHVTTSHQQPLINILEVQ